MISAPFQTILVAIDDSTVSDRALAAATDLAKALEAKLMIVHVLNPHDIRRPRSPHAYANSADITGDESLREVYEQEWINYVNHYESMLQQKTDEAIAAGVNADFVHPHGTPESALCELARTYNVSLLVVGSHQRKGVAEIMLGSVSNYIVHHAPCSVLVVYAGETDRERTALDEASSENMNITAV